MEPYTKRELFSEPAFSELEPVYGKQTDGLGKTVERLLSINGDERLIIRADIMDNGRSVNYNKKHLPVLDIGDAVGITPTQKARSAYSDTGRFRLSGYGWEQDGNMVTVPLVKVLKGAQLFAYEVSQPGWRSDVKFYTDAPHITEQGGIAVVQVSSRREKEPRHTVRLTGIPMAGSDWRLFEASNADCEDNLFRDVAYHSGQKRRTASAHGAAAYFKTAALLAEQGNSLAARFSPFAYVAQDLIDMYKRGTRHAQVEFRDDQGKKHRRPLNEIELETLATTYVAGSFGSGFDARGKLALRDWS